jgi:hypothetical protein
VAWYALTGEVPPPVLERAPLPLLVPGVPPALAALLDDAASPAPPRRPSAAELARECAAVGPGEPVHLVPSDLGAAPSELLTHRLRAAAAAAQEEQARASSGGRARWRRIGRGLGAVGAAVAVFAGAWGVSGWVVGQGETRPLVMSAPAVPTPPEATRGATSGATLGPVPEATPPPTAEPVPELVQEPVPEPVQVPVPPDAAVTDLAAARARAYLAADPGLLVGVDAPASAAEEVDTAAITAMLDAGTRVRGLAFSVGATEVVQPGPGTARVRAEVTTSAHEQVLADGSVVAVPASPPVTSLLLLEEHGSTWLLAGTG